MTNHENENQNNIPSDANIREFKPTLEQTARNYQNHKPGVNDWLLAEDVLDDGFPDEIKSILGVDRNNVKARLATLMQTGAHGSAAVEQFVLSTLHKMLLSGYSVERIAEQFDVRVQTVNRWVRALHNRLEREVARLNPNLVIADSMATLKQIRAQTWYMMQSEQNTSDKLKAMAIAQRNEKTLHEVLDKAKFYDRKGYVPKETEDYKPKQQANFLMDSIQNILGGVEPEHDAAYQSKLDEDSDQTMDILF